MNFKLNQFYPIHIVEDPHAVSNLHCEQGPLFEKYITCTWKWHVPPEQETIVLSSGAYRSEKEVNGRSIIFEGGGLKYGQSYLISIRDAAETVTLKGKLSLKLNVHRIG